MRYISVFSGIEAASVAWEPLGWEPVAFCEIDEFPSAVLRKRFPDVLNLGDITKVDWSPYRGTVDLVVGGSPCQSFSLAGKREGLAGESGLMYEYIRCIQEVMPEWFIWENVPGAFSSEQGWAFEQLLSALDECGYGLAWRVLDAQFFGVAQRRRRVFLVGHLGDMRAAEVLFESESMRWDTPSSREKRQALAAHAGRGSAGAGECLTQYGDEMCGTLRAKYDGSPTPDNGQNVLVQPMCMASAHTNAEIGQNVSPTLIAHIQKDAPIVIDRSAFNQGQNAQYPPHIEQTDVMDTLVARGPHAVGYSCQTETA